MGKQGLSSSSDCASYLYDLGHFLVYEMGASLPPWWSRADCALEQTEVWCKMGRERGLSSCDPALWAALTPAVHAQRSCQIMPAECWLRDTHSSLTSVVRSRLLTSLTDMTYWSLNFVPGFKKKCPCLLGCHYSASSEDFSKIAELTVAKVKNIKK